MSVVFSSIRRRAGIPKSNRKACCGAVAFIQRFSDALNLDPHFHLMALDGIYIENNKSELTFLHVGPPSDGEVARVAGRIHRRVMRLMERRGIGPDGDSQDTLQLDEPLLAELYSASISGRVATGPRRGHGLRTRCKNQGRLPHFPISPTPTQASPGNREMGETSLVLCHSGKIVSSVI